MNWLRVFFVGGLTSYRALFHWLNPWIFVPMLIIYPVFQMLFFVYLGRTAGVESDTFFVIGNVLLAAATPALWGMSHSINGERRSQTLATLLGSPASRMALFLGRGVPTMANGFVVSLLCFGVGVTLLEVDIGRRALPGLALAILVSTYSCTALGMCIGAFGLRGRNVTVLDNLVLAALFLACGANVPLERLPEWIETISTGLPLTHGIAAARDIAAGASIADVSDVLLAELAVGAAWGVLGTVLLKLFEYESKRTASLEMF